MDTLPVELFSEILGHLPPAARKSARLTSRQFNAVLAAPTFGRLRAFLDPDTALATLRATLHDLPGRPRAMWSPHCSVPDGLPLPRSFLRALCAALGGPRTVTQRRRLRCALADSSSSEEEEESGSEESEVELLLEDEEDVSTAAMLRRRLGRPELSEKMLRQALFRYALYKSYTYDGEGEAPQLWVMKSSQWKYQL